MAKSTKHADKIGSFDDFRAPWETEAGEETEVNKPVLRRLMYNLKLGEAKAKDAVDDAKADVEAANTERDEAKEQAADGSGAEAQKKIDKLTKERDEAIAERDSLKSEKEVAELRKEVLGEFEGKYPKAAKYVKGETEEELTESLKEVAEDWGIDLDNLDGNPDDESDEGEEEEPKVSTRPRSKSLMNPGDKENGKGGEQEYDFDKAAEQIMGSSLF